MRTQKLRMEVDGENAAKVFSDINKIVEANSDAVTRILVEVDSDKPLTNDKVRTSVEEITVIDSGNDNITFEAGSNAFKVATCISDLGDRWLDSGEIRRCIEANTDVDLDKLSQTLWDLSQRGLLDKRPCESDGRMKEYRISEKGEKSLVAVNEQ